ncbi:hypothetical protein BT96DRAFT_987980 [Gymnopus androsaceus JB14]|uniref:Uncharacterized protein n=1 Tax=Gymnopus androsaceus JB14 TaxID=1447944 RepID=A0A6A4I9L6_9AGAR|nr:hypothetical protein BT96DRAFT_987980 [Gymnopus androsaceus JB14]
MSDMRFLTLTLGGCTPPDGLSAEMPFRKGGYRQPPLPLIMQCPDAEFADFVHSHLQPLVAGCKTPSDFSVRHFVEQPDFKVVEQKTGASEALSSVDASTNANFQVAYAFPTLKEGILCLTGSSAPTKFIYEYCPSRKPSASRAIRRAVLQAPTPPPITRPASPEINRPTSRASTPPTPTPPSAPSTPSRRFQRRAAEVSNVFSPSIHVHVNSAEHPQGPAHRRGAYWGCRLLQALELSEAEMGELELALLSRDRGYSSFMELVHREYPLDISDSIAELLWDMYRP